MFSVCMRVCVCVLCVCVCVCVCVCACVCVCVYVCMCGVYTCKYMCVCVMHTCMYVHVQFNSYRKELMNNALMAMLIPLKEDLMVYCRLLSALM